MPPTPTPPPAKRKGKATHGVATKVHTLENQMQKVQSSLDNVISLLHRVLPQDLSVLQGAAASTGPDPRSITQQHPYTSAGSTVRSPSRSIAITSTSRTSHVLPPQKSPTQPILTLEQWVQQVESMEGSNQLLPLSPTTAVSHGLLSQSLGQNTSVEDDEEYEREAIFPFMTTNMLREEETARLRADGRLKREESPLISDTWGPRHGRLLDDWSGESSRSRGRKRKREAYSHDRVTQRGTMSTSVLDAVDIGLCTEAEGRELFRLFFHGSHSFMPVFDPSEDTWESLRLRSPFSITTILFVGKKIQDAGGPISETQRLLREHAESIGKTTLFSPIATIEALQAMIILASWGDTGWRPGTHALSMAFDLELYKCLPRLSESNRKRRHAVSLADDTWTEKSLVVGARLWLLVSKMSIEMAYNYGRPLAINEADVLVHAYALLNHPLQLPTDARLVAACEYLLHRVPLHQIFLSKNEQSLDEALQVFNDSHRGWEMKWQQYYLQQGIAEDDILVTDCKLNCTRLRHSPDFPAVTTQRCFGSVLANSCLLHSVKNARDVVNLPHSRRRWLLSSLDDARLVTTRILAKEKGKLLYANHFSHVALASVLRIYIRLASLFPDAVDLRQTGKDLTQLAEVLAQFPGVHFAYQLRDAIRKARKKHVLPAETRPVSPHAFEGALSYSHADPPLGGHPMVHESAAPAFHNNHSPLDFDLFLAEQMLQNPLHIPHSLEDQAWDFPMAETSFSMQPLPTVNAVGQATQLPWFHFSSSGEFQMDPREP
ncbi:hypothetical protein P7C73_g3535, partial [Tremellales sp. Uapishka_1]